jgi:hypothetical protein
MVEEEHATQAESEKLPKKRHGCIGCVSFAVGIGLIVVIIVVATVVVPAMRYYHEVTCGRQCANNLKQIGCAMNLYADKYHGYPPAYTVDKQGNRTHSWRALLLEFIDPKLYANYDLTRPWNSPGNMAIAEKMKENGPYHCPLEGSKTLADTSYVMITGPAAFGDGPRGRKASEIPDGLDRTVAIVEMSPSGILWSEPRDLDAAEMSYKINDPKRVGPRSCHEGGAFFLYADGSVRYIGEGCFENVVRALITVNGGEKLDFVP